MIARPYKKQPKGQERAVMHPPRGHRPDVFANGRASEVRDIWIVRRRAGQWTQPAAVDNDQWTVPGCPVNGPAVATAGGQTAIAWYTYAGERASVRVAFSDDDGQKFGAPIEVDGPRGRHSPIGRVDKSRAAGSAFRPAQVA